MVYKGPSWTVAGNINYLNNLSAMFDQKAQYHLSRANYHDRFYNSSREHKQRYDYHMNKYYEYDGKAQSILWQIMAIEGGF